MSSKRDETFLGVWLGGVGGKGTYYAVAGYSGFERGRNGSIIILFKISCVFIFGLACLSVLI